MTTRKEVPKSFEQGPYVQVACFCEKVLREGDGVMSLIRIVDLINHAERGPNAPLEMPEIRYPLQLVLALKSGRARGRHELRITPELPSGETMSSNTMTVQLEGEGRGANIVAGLDIPYKMEGLYWFMVYFDGVLLTKLPLDIRYQRLVIGSSASGA